MSDSITCPNCKTEIPLTEAISHEVEERLRAEFEGEREQFATEKERLVAEREAAGEQEAEKWGLKLREEELIKEQMQKRIDDLQAAANQKRSGLQGEVMERGIEEMLGESFPTDEIEPVKSGARGADVLQSVRSG